MECKNRTRRLKWRTSDPLIYAETILAEKDRFWVTFAKEDARSLLEGERVYPCYYPTNRNLKKSSEKYSGCMEGTQKGEAGSADLFRSGGCSSFLFIWQS